MRTLLVLLLSTSIAFGQAGRPPIDKYSQLTDVNVSGLQIGNVMVWGGTVWVPGTSSSGSLPSISGQSGKFLTNDGAALFWGTVPFSAITGKPTTAFDYGIVGGANIDLWGAKVPYAGTLVIASGKTVTFPNTFSITATDGATLNIGTGGTLGANAFNSTAFALQSFTINGHPLSGNVVVTKADLGLGYLFSGAGSPEGAITAPIGSQYARTDGGVGTSFYVKQSGTGNTGWSAAIGGSGGLPTGGVVGQVLVKNSSTDFDASWAADPGGVGGGGGTVLDVGVLTANGVSATTANATDHPRMTFSLGAITPSSVAATGTVTGTNITGTNTGDQTITLTGPVTGSGTGTFATSITNGSISLGKLNNITANSILGNNTVSLASPIALGPVQVKTLLSLDAVENTALSTWPGSLNITTLSTTLTSKFSANVTGIRKSSGAGSTDVAAVAGVDFLPLNTIGDLSITATGNISFTAGTPAGNISFTPGTSGAALFKNAFLQDPVDTTKKAMFDASRIHAATTRTISIPDDDSTTVSSPTAATRGLFANGTVDFLSGRLGTSQIFQSDVQATIDVITSAPSGIHTIPASTTNIVDLVKLNMDLSGGNGITVVLPPITPYYSSGQRITFIDTNGQVSTATPITITTQGGDNINGGTSPINLTNVGESKLFVATVGDPTHTPPIPNNWSIGLSGGQASGLGIHPYGTPVPDAAAVTVACNPATVKQHWKLNATTTVGATRNFVITGFRDGEEFDLLFTHAATNDTVIVQPGSGYTPSNGLGLLNLSTTVGAVDLIEGSIDGMGNVYLKPPVLNLTKVIPPSFTTLADSGSSATVGTLTTNPIGSLVNNTLQSFQILAGSSYTCGKIGVNLRKHGSPTGKLTMAIYDDDVGYQDGGAIVTSGSSTVTTANNLATWLNGQNITGGGITGLTWASGITGTTTLTLSSSKSSVTAKNAASSVNGITILGKINPTPRVTSAQVDIATGVPTSFGTDSPTNTGYTNFSGFQTAFATNTTYWVAISTDTISATDYVEIQSVSGNGGWVMRVGQTIAGPGSKANDNNINGQKANFNTYK